MSEADRSGPDDEIVLEANSTSTEASKSVPPVSGVMNEALARIESIRQASSVSWADVVTVTWYRNDTDDSVSCVAAEHLSSIRAKFEKAYGSIEKDYFCEKEIGGVVLTATGSVQVVGNSDNPDYVALENQCVSAAALIDHMLRGRSRRTAANQLYSALTRVADFGDLFPQELKTVSGSEYLQARRSTSLAVEAACQLVNVYCQRDARMKYLRGTVLGAAASGLIASLGAYLISRFESPWVDPVVFLAAVAFGALGALVSVLTRIASGNLILDVHAGKHLIGWLGAGRSLLGGALGLLVAMLAESSLIPLEVPSTTQSLFAYIACLAFLAGFTERYAIDLVERAGRVIASDSERAQDVDSDGAIVSLPK